MEKCVYGKIGSESETVKPLQFSVMGAVGAQYNISRRVGVYVEPGVSYFFDDGSDVQTIRKENPCNFTLQGDTVDLLMKPFLILHFVGILS